MINRNSILKLRNMFLLILLLAWVPSAMAGHGKYSGEAIVILDKVTDILITNEYCTDLHDCRRKEFSFGSGDDKGVYAGFYQVNKPEVINQIISLYTSVYFKHNKKIDIELKFNDFSIRETKWYKTSYIQLKFKGI